MLNYIIEEFLKTGSFKASIAYYRARSEAKTSSAVTSHVIESDAAYFGTCKDTQNGAGRGNEIPLNLQAVQMQQLAY